MPESNLAVESFLPPYYEKVLAPFDGIFVELEFPSNPEMGIMKQLRGHVKRIRQASAGIAKFKHQEDRYTAEVIEDAEDPQEWLAVTATKTLATDLLLKTMLKTTGLATAITAAEGDDHAAAIGEGVGMRIILQRARLTVSSQLGAADLLLKYFEGDDVRGSTWDRAQAAHAQHPSVRSPVSIDEDEGRSYGKIIEQLRSHNSAPQSDPLIKLGRSRLLNSIRTALFVRRTVSQLGSSMSRNFEVISTLVESLIAAMPAPLELDAPTLRRTWRTSTRMSRYLQSAAALDPSVAGDPKAQFFMCLLGRMDGYDVKSENVVFSRDVRVTATRLRNQITPPISPAALEQGNLKPDDKHRND